MRTSAPIPDPQLMQRFGFVRVRKAHRQPHISRPSHDPLRACTATALMRTLRLGLRGVSMPHVLVPQNLPAARPQTPRLPEPVGVPHEGSICSRCGLHHTCEVRRWSLDVHCSPAFVTCELPALQGPPRTQHCSAVFVPGLRAQVAASLKR